MNKVEFVGNKYIPQYAGDFFSKPWYERDMMGVIWLCWLSRYGKKPNNYFQKTKVMNFDIIHHEARGDKLDGPYEGYHTVKNNDLKKYPAL